MGHVSISNNNTVLLKKIAIAGLVLLIIFIAVQVLKTAYQTPVFTGRIINSISRLPVKDAVVTAVFWKSSNKGLVPFYSVSSVTDEKGEYSIPKHRRVYASRFYLTDPYFYISFGVTHPLYDGIDSMLNIAWEEKNKETGKISFKGEKRPDGSIKYDIALDGLYEKYLLRFKSTNENRNETERLTKTRNPGNFQSHLDNYATGWYWKVLKEKNVPFDISETFNKWEYIAREIDNMNAAENAGKTGGINFGEEVFKKRVEILTNLGL